MRFLFQLLIGILAAIGAWALFSGKREKQRQEQERLATEVRAREKAEREKAELEQKLAAKNAQAHPNEERQISDTPRNASGSRSRHAFWVWLYSNGNLLGSALALAGLGLYFSGLIDASWWFIIPGLYVAGFLIAPPPRRPAPATQMQMDLHAALDMLQQRARKGLSAERLESFERLIESLRDTLPLLETQGVGDRTAYTLRQTILDYLPATLDNYLRLPVAYRRMHKLADGRTPRQVFVAQLNTLNHEVQSSLAALAENDTQQLLANERFLADRFSRPESF